MVSTRNQKSPKKPSGKDEPLERKSKQTDNGNRGRPAGAKAWQAWEDRAIAKQAQASQPWDTSKHEGGVDAGWDAVAVAISSANEAFVRSGSSCQARFKKLLEMHKRQETRDHQKTGEAGEIDEHVQVMTDLYELLHD